MAATAVRLLASTDGASWSEAGAATVFEADADNVGYLPGGLPGATVAVAREVVFGAPLADGAVFYLAWQVSVAEGASSGDMQALGVDDVTVTPVFEAGTVLRIR